MATTKKAAAPRKQTSTTAKKAPAKKPAPTRPAATPKPVSKTAIAKKPAAKPSPVTKVEKPVKTKKPKLVRDSFTVPKAEYVVLDELKQRAARLTRPVKKSELLRAGIKALAAMSDTAFLSALDQVPAIKTGRPAA
ncbi:hypothetical protein [Polaromonas sp. A23]|uniref:hypothetical protein n=1 Tax=Polaromonas sp. A23 TaxID=1944133 RepID=UPI00098607BA|nr:hypothetical protein [Polaromonas sp. A23]OOG40491.1 hypothetical protein B0B52_13400 [Polaromonas sp. A23]